MEPKPKTTEKLSEGKRKETMTAMRDSYVIMTANLQKSLLDVPEMSGSCKLQKSNISSKDRQILTVVISCHN